MVQTAEFHDSIFTSVLTELAMKHPFRVIDISVDQKPRAPREIDEEQHVAGRERSDEGLLRVDTAGIVPGRGHDVRTRTRGDGQSAIEFPRVRAAVLAFGEVALAL